MIPLHHSNRPNANTAGNSLTRKSSRPSKSCKSLPYNGSASYYVNRAPPLPEMAPPPPSNFRQRFPQSQRPTILSLHQPAGMPSDGPFLMPPPKMPYHRGGNGQVDQQRLTFSVETMSTVSMYDQMPREYQYRPGANVPFYCERRVAQAPKRRIYRKLFLFALLMILGGWAAYKFELLPAQITDIGNCDLYQTVFEGDWYTNVTAQLSRSAILMKEQVQLLTKSAYSGVDLVIPKSDPGAPLVILSVDEDSETTVQVVDG